MISKLIRNLAIASIASIPFYLVIQSVSAQPQTSKVIFANRTGATLTSLQTAPAQSRQWQGNILPKDLPSNSEIELAVANSQDCQRDLKAVFSDGSTIEDYGVDFCKNDIYTFTVQALW